MDTGAVINNVNTNNYLVKESDNEDNNNINHYLSALHAIQASFLPMVLHAAVELNVFDILAKTGHGNGLTVKEISNELSGCRNPDAPMFLDRMLRLLASHSMVSCTIWPTNDGGSERRYGLSPISKFFVGDENGKSLGPVLALYIDPVIQASWSKLKEAVLEGGIPFNKVHGMHAYEYPTFDLKFNHVFNEAMFKQPSFTILKLLEEYHIFEGINKLVDVGGGLGHMLRIIVAKYPSIRCFNFDLPHVIREAEPYPGVHHIGGDMFSSVPQGDAILLKWVLQVWNDENCIKVLENCYKSIPNNGKVIIMEEIVPDQPEATNVAQIVSEIDAYLMIKNPGGRLRTFKEFVDLGTIVGFKGITIIGNVAELSVLEFCKS
ncbi:cathecol O-methyltransferase 1-like [Silene latifolia]|uniref:cathecol O-methyltransferase 1-like n=1 Tax=Silene latifolia TaxID=37657 RepID=UPI003D76D0F9